MSKEFFNYFGEENRYGEKQCERCGAWNNPKFPCDTCICETAEEIYETEGLDAWKKFLKECDLTDGEIQGLLQTKMEIAERKAGWDMIFVRNVMTQIDDV